VAKLSVGHHNNFPDMSCSITARQFHFIPPSQLEKYNMSNKRILITDNNGDLINMADVHSVKIVNGGVMIAGPNNRLLHFIKVSDKEMATLIRDELITAVEMAAVGKKYQPNWSTGTSISVSE
jgi:hypothetical protein